MKEFGNFLKNLALVIWQLPQDIVALVMYPFLGKKTLIKVEKGTRIYEGSKMKGGISLGNFIFLSPYLAKREESIAHELGHCVDSKMMGWFYLLIIGIPSLLWASFKPSGACYYSFFTEKRANKHAGLSVGKNKYGCWIYFPKIEHEKHEETIASAINKLTQLK